MSENDSIRIIDGDGTLSETLARAQLEDADLFISVTGQDTVNGLAAQKAKLIFEVGQVIARVRDPSLAELYSSLDLGIYCPTDVAVSNIVESVTREG
jgi:Trk K+ transport system NAD-binding subunit